MTCRVGYKELAGRGGVSFEIEEDTIDMCFGVFIGTFRYCVGKRGVSIDKLECVVGEFTQVMMYRFIRTMHGCINAGVVDIDPERFV
jgi:hypothetical protein